MRKRGSHSQYPSSSSPEAQTQTFGLFLMPHNFFAESRREIYEASEKKKACNVILFTMRWSGERRVTTDLKALPSMHGSGPPGFLKKRPRTFQSHFRAYRVNIHCKLFIFANKGDFFFPPKGHLYP